LITPIESIDITVERRINLRRGWKIKRLMFFGWVHLTEISDTIIVDYAAFE
jgi:hypothetical protein